MVTLSWCHSTNHTPSVSPYGLPAPPPGSRGPRCPHWGWCSAQRIKIVMIASGNHTSVSCRVSGKGGVVGNFELVAFNESHPLSQAVRPASSPTGEPRFPCCPHWGWCRDSGKGGGIGNFEPLPSNEPHPLSQPLRAASSPIGEPRESQP